MSASFITPGHVRAFQSVTTQLYGEVTLTSWRIGDEPGIAILLLDSVGEKEIVVISFFGVVTESMKLSFEKLSKGGLRNSGSRTMLRYAKKVLPPCPD